MGDYVIFTPNPHYTYHNNFAIRKVTKVENYSFIIVDGDYGEPNKNFISFKHKEYYKKLHTKKSWDLKEGDYFFNKEDSVIYHGVYIVNNIKLGGVICNLQPLNYDGGVEEENTLVNHSEILVPDDETKKIIDEKINRIKKGR